MPRPTRVRKDPVSRALDARDQRVDVAQTQRLWGVRAQHHGIGQFLDGLAEFAANKRRSDHAQQAKADHARGTVDPELMEDSRVYRENINSMNATRDVLSVRAETLSRLPAALQEAEAAGEEFDPDEYFRVSTENFLSSEALADDSYAAATGEVLERLRLEVSDAGLKARATRELAEAEQAATGLVYNLARNGVFDYEATKRLVMDDAGFTPNQADGIIVNGVMSYLQQATSLEQLTVYDNLLGELSDKQKARFGSDLKKAHEAALRRVDTISTQQKADAERQRVDQLIRFNQQAATGALNLAEMREMAEAGVITQADRLQLENQNFAALRKGNKEAEVELEAAQQAARFEAIYANPAAAAQLNSTDTKKFREYMEDKFVQEAAGLAGLAQQVVAAQEAGDEDAIAELEDALYANVDGLTNHFQAARGMGYTPRWIKNYLSGARDPAHPSFRAAVVVAGAIQDRYGEDALAEIPDEVLVNIDAYRDLEEVGMSSQEIISTLTGGEEMSIEDTRAALRQDSDFSSELDDALDDLYEIDRWSTLVDSDIANRFPIQEKMLKLASLHYRRMGDAEAAVEWASKKVQASHEVVDGRLIPTSHVRKGFGEAWDAHRDLVLDNLRSSGLVGEDQDIILLPINTTGSRGQLGLYLRNFEFGDALVPVVKDSKPLVVNPEQMLETFGALKEAEEKAGGAATFDRATLIRNHLRDNPGLFRPHEPIQ